MNGTDIQVYQSTILKQYDTIQSLKLAIKVILILYTITIGCIFL
jgi:hypothetical protein